MQSLCQLCTKRTQPSIHAAYREIAGYLYSSPGGDKYGHIVTQIITSDKYGHIEVTQMVTQARSMPICESYLTIYEIYDKIYSI